MDLPSLCYCSTRSNELESKCNLEPPGRRSKKTELSPIRSADDSQLLSDNCNNLVIEDENSWDRAADSPTSTSWSMNSCSTDDDGNTVGSIHEQDSYGDNDYDSNTEGIVQCLLDLRQRGVLYQGVKPIISTIFTSQFIFFFLLAYAKGWLMRVLPTSSKQASPWLSLLSSCMAGIGNVLLTNPLWVTNMAIVSGTTETQNLFLELLRLRKERGLRQLWTGTDASLLLVSNPIIQFVCYEQFKRVRLVSKARQRQSTRRTIRHSNNVNTTGTLRPMEAFLIAALAKAIATVTTYPLQLSQTLLRLSSSNNQSSTDNKHVNCDSEEDIKPESQRQQYKGTIDCLIQLYKKNDDGCAAWFTGMRAKLLQTVLTAAFTFLTYEQILGVVKRVALYTIRMRQSRIGEGHRKQI